KLFSFNNPAGACGTCDGLGVRQFFDARKVVTGTSSLASGAIRGWDRRNIYYFQRLGSLAAHYGFDLDAPFDSLRPEAQNHTRYGSGKQNVPDRFLTRRRAIVSGWRPFAGIPHNVGRRYSGTSSVRGREDLAKYLGTQPFPDGMGTRLRREARHVWIGGKTL